MALKAETIAVICNKLKIPKEDFEKALNEEAEVDITIDESLQVFTKTEVEARDRNTADENKKIGIEIGSKNVRKAAGLPDEIGKDPAAIAAAIVKKAVDDAKIEPSAKVMRLNEQITQLQQVITDKDEEVNSLKLQTANAKRESEMIGYLPKNRSESLTDSEYIALIKGIITVEECDGAVLVKNEKKETIRHPTTKDPIGVKEAIAGIFESRKGWLQEGGPIPPSGRGGKDTPPKGTTFTKLSDFTKQWQETNQGKSINGMEYQAAQEKAIKDNPDMDLNG